MGPAGLAADEERPATHVRVSGALCFVLSLAVGQPHQHGRGGPVNAVTDDGGGAGLTRWHTARVTDIREFIAACIKEDADAAQAVLENAEPDAHWDVYYWASTEDYREVRDALTRAVLQTTDELPAVEVAEHTQLHDPERVLADCDAKRRLMERLLDDPEGLRELASCWRHHPAYLEKWQA